MPSPGIGLLLLLLNFYFHNPRPFCYTSVGDTHNNITGPMEEEAIRQEERQREQLASYYLAMRADGLSIVSTAERALITLGYPIQSAIRSRKERRKHKELYDEQPL